MIEKILDVLDALIARMLDTGKADPRALAVAVECYQQYIDYLDELETNLRVEPSEIIVQVQGETIKFKDIGDAASWITSLS